MDHSPDHRGTTGDMRAFALKFVPARTSGFVKDMRICLKGMAIDGQRTKTHAYLPATAACLSFLEYLAGLHHGKPLHADIQHIVTYADAFFTATRLQSRND